MGFIGNLLGAIVKGAINEMGKGMDAAKRSQSMSDEQLLNNALSTKNGWDKAAAQYEIKRRYGKDD